LDIVYACGALAIIAGVVAGFAWSRPTVEATASVLHYTQSGNLSYSAPVPSSSIYGSAGLQTGQPVYTSVVDKLNVAFSYQFQATAPAALSGSEQLVATIYNGQGISRSFALQPVRRFSGDHFDATAILDLSAFKTAANVFDEVAGQQGSYTVNISPNVKVHGSLGPRLLSATFDPQVQFGYSSSALVPTSGSSGGASQTGAGQGGAASLIPTSPGSLSVPSAQPATILLKSLKVADVRVGALAALALVLLFGALAGWRLLAEATSDDEAVRIATRYGATLVEARALPDSRDMTVVEMQSFAGLMQVARRLECPVLHQGGVGDQYAVVDNGTLYRYRTAAKPAPPAISIPSTNGSEHIDLAVAGRRH